jgi:hypothetical protein
MGAKRRRREADQSHLALRLRMSRVIISLQKQIYGIVRNTEEEALTQATSTKRYQTGAFTKGKKEYHIFWDVTQCS